MQQIFFGIRIMEPDDKSPEKFNDHFNAYDYLDEMDKIIRTLTLRAMAEGNEKDFHAAFLNMELALWMSRSLGKKCLEATLLNNLGLLYIMQGAWDKAMLTFDRSMETASASCSSGNNIFATLKKNISSLFDPAVTTPRNPKY